MCSRWSFRYDSIVTNGSFHCFYNDKTYLNVLLRCVRSVIFYCIAKVLEYQYWQILKIKWLGLWSRILYTFIWRTLTPSFTFSLPRQLSNAVPPGPVPEEYLRGFRPYATTEDALRMPSLPLGMDPATAAAAAAYYHPSYLPHPSFTPYR